jgi:hypothetical protein
MLRTNKILLIDSFIIFLNLSTSYSIIPYIICHTPNRYINMFLIFGLNTFYYFLRFRRLHIEKTDFLFRTYVILQLICFIAAYITNTGWSSVLVYSLLNVSFYFILCQLFKDYIQQYSYDKAFWLLFRGYIFLALLSVLGAIGLFLLIKTGFNPFQNDVSFRYDLFYDNCVSFGAVYYFPLNLSIIDITTDIRIPFFQEEGLITGMYHEPHCMTFMVFPALFILLYYKKNRGLTLLLYTLVLLLAASTTNIMAVLGCILVYFLYVLRNSLIKTVSFICILSAMLAVFIHHIDISNLDFIFNKMGSGSATYSMSTFDFALSPKTLFGSSFFNLDYINSRTAAERMDVGYISFFLNSLFLVGCVYCMLKLFVSHSTLKVAVLLFATYFFIHSTKVAMVSYSLTMLMFVVFILYKVSSLPDKLLCNDKNS